jgi:hypothetical protein
MFFDLSRSSSQHKTIESGTRPARHGGGASLRWPCGLWLALSASKAALASCSSSQSPSLASPKMHPSVLLRLSRSLLSRFSPASGDSTEFCTDFSRSLCRVQTFGRSGDPRARVYGLTKLVACVMHVIKKSGLELERTLWVLLKMKLYHCPLLTGPSRQNFTSSTSLLILFLVQTSNYKQAAKLLQYTPDRIS